MATTFSIFSQNLLNGKRVNQLRRITNWAENQYTIATERASFFRTCPRYKDCEVKRYNIEGIAYVEVLGANLHYLIEVSKA